MLKRLVQSMASHSQSGTSEPSRVYDAYGGTTTTMLQVIKFTDYFSLLTCIIPVLDEFNARLMIDILEAIDSIAKGNWVS